MYRELVTVQPRVVATIHADKTHLSLGETVSFNTVPPTPIALLTSSQAKITLTLRNISSKPVQLLRGHGFRLEECDGFSSGRLLKMVGANGGIEGEEKGAHYIGPFYRCGTGKGEEEEKSKKDRG